MQKKMRYSSMHMEKFHSHMFHMDQPVPATIVLSSIWKIHAKIEGFFVLFCFAMVIC